MIQQLKATTVTALEEILSTTIPTDELYRLKVQELLARLSSTEGGLRDNAHITIEKRDSPRGYTEVLTVNLMVIPSEDWDSIRKVLEYVLRKAGPSTDAYKSAKKLIGEKENWQL